MGSRIQYLSRSNGQWYPGVVAGTDASGGCTVQLDVGGTKTVPASEVASRVISAGGQQQGGYSDMPTLTPAAYQQPMMQAPSYQQPMMQQSYAAPAVTQMMPAQTYAAPVQTYAAPVQTYEAPVQTYAAPVQTYAAPVQTYAAPVQTYAAPVQTYAAPVQTYAAPVEVMMPMPLQSAPSMIAYPSGPFEFSADTPVAPAPARAPDTYKAPAPKKKKVTKKKKTGCC